MLKGLTIRGSIVGTRQDMVEALDFYARGHIHPTYHLRRLDEINQVFDEMSTARSTAASSSPSTAETSRTGRHGGAAGACPVSEAGVRWTPCARLGGGEGETVPMCGNCYTIVV